MKKYFTLLFLLVVSTATFAQQNPEKKIKIALLGSLHFTTSTQDMYSNEAMQLSSQKLQEIDEVVNKLAAFNPDQICIEVEVKNQEKTNLQYQQYLKGEYELELNEIDLLGFQAAKKISLENLTCVNYKGEFNTDPVFEAAKKYGQTQILEELNTFATAFIEEMNESERTSSLKEHLIYINKDDALHKNLAIYTKYNAQVGQGESYEGADLNTSWYKTNLRIYSNILREIKPSDQAILVIYGQGHVALLKHFFSSHPDFEIIDIEEVLD
ncbi:DUF5694 domain-containing protein [Belliella sp. DSM 111904]|uniref:DUF5694 domain-containing protein n=1 Tax=Belliella filtrata TaxID=2923435 RepID=A0ABS9V519_9BACT|nr:DUF5694 domain-containing protein [Belliella filtrata]MCH7411497.1 DUF5694 domain-containing protein [Belliella filtrata]